MRLLIGKTNMNNKTLLLGLLLLTNNNVYNAIEETIIEASGNLRKTTHTVYSPDLKNIKIEHCISFSNNFILKGVLPALLLCCAGYSFKKLLDDSKKSDQSKSWYKKPTLLFSISTIFFVSWLGALKLNVI